MEDSYDLNSFLNIGERGSDSVVFHIGSHSIKFGLASQFQPFIIPTCIAHKLNDTENMQIDSESINEQNELFLNNYLNMEQDILKKIGKLEQKLKKNKLISSNKPYPNIKVNHTNIDIRSK
jgi:actin-related protein